MSDTVAIEGVSYGVFGKSVKFQGDLWEEPEFVPLSQCEIEQVGSEEQGRCVLHIKKWLVQKNGWA
jgi:hypothetical protein